MLNFSLRSSFCRRIVTHSTYLRNALMALNCATHSESLRIHVIKIIIFPHTISMEKQQRNRKSCQHRREHGNMKNFHSIVDFVVFIQCLNRNNITCRMRSSSSKHSLFSRMIRYTWMNVVMMRRRFLLILQFDQIHSTSNTVQQYKTYGMCVCLLTSMNSSNLHTSSLRFVCVSFSCGSRV